jgi:hypothetical protein
VHDDLAAGVHADPESNRPFAPPDTEDIRAALAAALAALAKARASESAAGGRVIRVDALPPAQSTSLERHRARSARLGS